MYKTSKQEAFSVAYISVLAATLGFNRGLLGTDDGIDISFAAKYPQTAKIRSPQINFQLKCTEHLFSKDDYLYFKLSLKNYEDLCGTNQAIPCYLVVLCVPESEENWIEMKQEEMILRYSAYWYSLKDEPDSKNEENVTVKIPKSQKLDKVAFEMLMNKASEGIAL
jgi:hypothetical protein